MDVVCIYAQLGISHYDSIDMCVIFLTFLGSYATSTCQAVSNNFFFFFLKSCLSLYLLETIAVGDGICITGRCLLVYSTFHARRRNIIRFIILIILGHSLLWLKFFQFGLYLSLTATFHEPLYLLNI